MSFTAPSSTLASSLTCVIINLAVQLNAAQSERCMSLQRGFTAHSAQGLVGQKVRKWIMDILTESGGRGAQLMNKSERDTGYQCYRFRRYLNHLHWSNTEAVVTASYVKTKEKTVYFESNQSQCSTALRKQCVHRVNMQCFISGKQNTAYQLCNLIRIMWHGTGNTIVKDQLYKYA